jgi:carbon-monoxide dehydrogenase large subunit
VRYVGEGFAVVVADDPYRLADAIERAVVEYEPLPAAASAGTALSTGAPLVHDDWPDNLAGRSFGAVGDVAAGFAEAEVIVEARLRFPRVAGMPMEARGVVAKQDEVTGVLSVWVSTQVPFEVRSAIAATLSIPEGRVRVLVPDVGGGFGVKGHVYAEDIIVPTVTRRLGRPLKWVETRREHFLTAAADRDQEHQARMGLRRDGKITALQTTFSKDHGSYTPLGEAMAQNTINHLPGPYRISALEAVGLNVVTHKTFAAAYRGAGRPEAAFVLERLLDQASRRLEMDPAELRRRNLIRPDEMPFQSGLTYRDGIPITYDRADFPAAFEKALALLDYEAWRTEQAGRWRSMRPIGIGLANYLEGTGLGPCEGADIRVDPSGRVFVHVGVSAQGQGHETTLAQICAHELGVPIEDVFVIGGDTDRVSYGFGTIASRAAAVAGPAVAQAAREVAHKARLVGGQLLECAAEDLVLADARVSVKGVPSKSVRLADVARAAVRSRALAVTSGPGLSACGFFYPATITWAFGAHACAVEVDLETAAVEVLKYAVVHDSGRPINPMVVEGQLLGGIAQGIGSALMEELIYDGQAQLLTGTFMDYSIPRAAEIPQIAMAHVNYASMLNPLGIKGVGESGIIAPTAAIANAVEDALVRGGVVDGNGQILVTTVPLTGRRVFDLLRA